MTQPHPVAPVTLLHAEDHFTLARLTLRNPGATREQLAEACDILAYSHDMQDIWLVREIRHGLFAGPDAELKTPQALMAAIAVEDALRQSQAVVDLAEKAHRHLVQVAVFAFGWITGTAMCGLIVIGWW